MPPTRATATAVHGSRQPSRLSWKKRFSQGTTSTSAKQPPIASTSSTRHQVYGRAMIASAQSATRNSVSVVTLVSATCAVVWSERASM